MCGKNGREKPETRCENRTDGKKKPHGNGVRAAIFREKSVFFREQDQVAFLRVANWSAVTAMMMMRPITTS